MVFTDKTKIFQIDLEHQYVSLPTFYKEYPVAMQHDNNSTRLYFNVLKQKNDLFNLFDTSTIIKIQYKRIDGFFDEYIVPNEDKEEINDTTFQFSWLLDENVTELADIVIFTIVFENETFQKLCIYPQNISISETLEFLTTTEIQKPSIPIEETANIDIELPDFISDENNKIFYIDLESRNIIIPKFYKENPIAVQRDNCSNKLCFRMPKQYSNIFNLKNSIIKIQYKNANENYFTYTVPDEDKRIVDDYFEFTWLIDLPVTESDGRVNFKIMFQIYNYIETDSIEEGITYFKITQFSESEFTDNVIYYKKTNGNQYISTADQEPQSGITYYTITPIDGNESEGTVFCYQSQSIQILNTQLASVYIADSLDIFDLTENEKQFVNVYNDLYSDFIFNQLPQSIWQPAPIPININSEKPIYEIDLETRKIIEPPQSVGVEYDHNSNVIYFKCLKEFQGNDLSQGACVIQYINALGEVGIYAVPYYDIQGEYLIFPWVIDGIATKADGSIIYNIKFYNLSPETKGYIYNLPTNAYNGYHDFRYDNSSELNKNSILVFKCNVQPTQEEDVDQLRFFGIMTNNIALGYDFYLKKFKITKQGFIGPNASFTNCNDDDILTIGPEFLFSPNQLYDIKFIIKSNKMAIEINGKEQCSITNADYCRHDNDYIIFYPRGIQCFIETAKWTYGTEEFIWINKNDFNNNNNHLSVQVDTDPNDGINDTYENLSKQINKTINYNLEIQPEKTNILPGLNLNYGDFVEFEEGTNSMLSIIQQVIQNNQSIITQWTDL